MKKIILLVIAILMLSNSAMADMGRVSAQNRANFTVVTEKNS